MKKIAATFHLFDWLLVLGILLCLPMVWSYLQTHFFHLHDFTHVARLAEFERGLLDGQFPVRWSQNLGYGYGMPQFSFYGPLFYAEAFLFRLFGISYIWSIKLTVVSHALISFVVMYKLGELLWGRWAGLLTGIAGVYAPYRLVDMYVRGAFAEISGMTGFSLTLLAIVLWAKRPSWRRVVYAALAGTSIVISHTLMALMSALFVFIWLGYWVVKEKQIKRLPQVIVAGLLTAGLSAFFALPALLEKGYTRADQLTTGFSDYNQHFLYIRQLWQSTWGYGGSIWGPDDNISFELGKTHLVVVAFMLMYVVIQIVKRRRVILSPVVITVVLLGLSLFFTILKSKPIWDALPFMVYVQFPWRFLSLSAILLSLLVGASIQFLPKNAQGVSCGILIILIIYSQIGHMGPKDYLSQDTALYYSDPTDIQMKMSDIIPDFLPKDARPKALHSPITSNNRYQLPSPTRYSVEIDRSNEFLIRVQDHDTVTFTANIFDFPGWTIYYDGKILPHQTQQYGLIEAILPAGTGEHFISGRFEETPLRGIADCMTGISVFIAGMLCFVGKKGSHNAIRR